MTSNKNDVAEKFKYNGIEQEEALGLSLYEMPLRQYDPAIARWVSMDIVIHHDYSPYSAFDNNPVVWADPSGADAVVTNGGDNILFTGEDAIAAFNIISENNSGSSGGCDDCSKCPETCNNEDKGEEQKSGDNRTVKETAGVIVGEILYELGQPTQTTRGKTKGATKGTSKASEFWRKIFADKKVPKWLRNRIPKRAFGGPLRSPTVGGTLGRLTPILGRATSVTSVAFMIYDMTEMILNPDSPENQIKWRNARLHSTTTIGHYNTGPYNKDVNPQSSEDLNSKYGTDDLNIINEILYLFGL